MQALARLSADIANGTIPAKRGQTAITAYRAYLRALELAGIENRLKELESKYAST